jgi:hypothetical protein
VLAVTAAGRRLYERIRSDLVEEQRQLLEGFEPSVRKAAPQLAAPSRPSGGGA